MSKLIEWLKTPWFIALVGLLLLALIVWFGGPYLGLGGWQPLASPIARLVVILLLVVGWGLWLQLQALRARRKSAAMAEEMAGQEAAGGERGERQAAEREQLHARFAEAVGALRKTRRGTSNLYNVPWYVVIGPPGSGKSTLLQNSGLNFPLAGRFGNEGLRGVGGTRNCDWWFTDEAIFLDTAGRYTTQDSDRGADASAWAEFLKLLRKYRKRRPINGVILAMSVADLLTLDDSGWQLHVQAIRSRLDELAEHLRVSVPIYLVFTKCDLVAGFTEYFDELDPAGRNQVWGASFAIKKSADGTAAEAFDEEFDALLERLQTRLLDRLHSERDRGRRAAVFSFPQQIAGLRGIASSFVGEVFSAHRYAAPLLLRGFYLTSGTQEGTPIDRMMTAVARSFGLQAQQLAASGGSKRTFFVARLLKDVLFKESGLAGTDPRLERRNVLIQTATYAGVLALTVGLVALFVFSYNRNVAYLADVQSALEQYPSQLDLAAAPDTQTFFARLLERAEALAAAARVANRYRGDVPLTMGFGFYQGDSVGENVRDAYLRELNGVLLPSLAALFARRIDASADDPQALYYYLKAYLMLGNPERIEPAELEALAGLEWQRIFPGNPVLQEALGQHVAALALAPKQLRALTLDTELVEKARNTLRTADLARLIYAGLKLDAGQLPPLRLDRELGLLADVFERASGTPLNAPFPALYTQPVFADLVAEGIPQAVERFAEDDWVMGGGSDMAPVEKLTLTQDVITLYEQDYIQAWDALLADLQLQPIDSIQEASAVAAKLAGPNSPLKRLLMVVRENTAELLRAPPASSQDKAAELAKEQGLREATRRSRVASALARVGGSEAQQGADEVKPGAAISAHFEQVNSLTEGGPGAMPIDRTLLALKQLGETLLTMTDFDAAQAGQPNPQLLQARQQAQQMPPAVAELVTALTGSSEALMASGTKSALAEAYQREVQNACAAYTRGRYPFDPNSNSEIPLQNFAELFGTGGRFDRFFQQTLADLVDSSGRYWRWKPNAVGGSSAMLAQVQAAHRINEMFFRGGASPQVDFRLLATNLGAGVGKLDISVGGQVYTYEPGAATTSMAMTWPGPTPGHVSVAAYGTDGSLLAKYDYPGDWAFFRALQAARLEKQSELRFLANFDFGGRSAQVVIQAENLRNPFLSDVLRGFNCGG